MKGVSCFMWIYEKILKLASAQLLLVIPFEECNQFLRYTHSYFQTLKVQQPNINLRELPAKLTHIIFFEFEIILISKYIFAKDTM